MKKLLRTIKGEIISNEPLVVVLPDSVEKDITFKFYLRTNPDKQESFTEYIMISPTEAELSIYNAPEDKQTSIQEAIHVGTYMNKYGLYVNYSLWRKTKDSGTITINFYIEEEGGN